MCMPHVNKDTTRRVEGVFTFGDFTDKKLSSLLRWQFTLTGLDLHHVAAMSERLETP